MPSHESASALQEAWCITVEPNKSREASGNHYQAVCQPQHLQMCAGAHMAPLPGSAHMTSMY
jgi:hypothetical protein